MSQETWSLIEEARWWANWALENKEVIGALTVLAFPVILSFSARQRAAIRERDDNRCQATVDHNCNGDRYPLEVDHILPQGYMKKFGVDPDYPENALTKCREAHDIKHPERRQARATYHENHNSFVEAHQGHRDKLDQNQIYWNPDNDRPDTVRAVKRTQQARARGWTFPPPEEPRKKKK